MKLIAIDPGKKGAIAQSSDGWVNAQVMPLAGKLIDLTSLADLIRTFQPDGVILEKVGPMPGEGVASVWSFGSSFWGTIGMCGALQIPLELVAPQTWKAEILRGTPKDKDAAIAYCRRVYPQVSLVPPRCRVPHDGIADALCLLEYGRRKLWRDAA